MSGTLSCAAFFVHVSLVEARGHLHVPHATRAGGK